MVSAPARPTAGAISAVLLLAAALYALPASADGTVEVDGFARAVDAANSGDYPSNRSLAVPVPSSWAYGKDAEQTVTWETAPVPAALDADSVVFAWSCGLSRGAGTHRLELDGEPLVTFSSGQFRAPQRWVGEGAVLSFAPELVDFAGEVHGTMYLSLPATAVTPGQPLRLTVRAIDGNDWFMLHHYTGSHGFARDGAASLPSGRRVVLPPPKTLYVPASDISWPAPFRIASDPPAAEEVEIVAELRDDAGAAVTAPLRRTVHVDADAKALPVELWPVEDLPPGRWRLALSVGAAGQPPSGGWKGDLAIGDVSAFETAATSAAAALKRAAVTVEPGTVLADVSVPSTAYHLQMARQELMAVADPGQLEATLQALLDSVGAAADAAAQIARGQDPYAGQRGYALRAYRSELDGQLQPYGLLVPAGYTAQRRWPLVIMLHGSGSNPTTAMRRVLGSGSLAASPAATGFLVVTPYTRGNLGWGNEVGEDDVLRVLADVQRTHAVDPDSIYLTGLSMGGHGTWALGLRYPDRFAALAPVCGFTTWRVYGEADGLMATVSDELAPLVYADNALYLPIFVHHGGADPTVKVENSRQMVARLDSLGYEVEYAEYPDVGHNSWDLAYAGGAVFTWFRQHERDPWPERIVHVAAEPRRYGRDRWVRIDGLARAHQLGRVRAEVAAANRIVLQTDNVSELSLLLRAPLIDPRRPVRVETTDGRRCHEGPAPDDGWLSLQLGPHSCTPREPAGARPPAPPYGGVVGSLLGYHAFVYGTGTGTGGDSDGDGAAAGLVAASRSLAEGLALPANQRRLEYPVVADTALTDALRAGADLVLIGTPATNAVLAELLPELPLRWEGGPVVGDFHVGADQVLLLAHPRPRQPGRRLLVIAASTAAPLARLEQRRQQIPQGLPEWAVLAAGDSVVAMGTFDAAWQHLLAVPVPPAAP